LRRSSDPQDPDATLRKESLAINNFVGTVGIYDRVFSGEHPSSDGTQGSRLTSGAHQRGAPPLPSSRQSVHGDEVEASDARSSRSDAAALDHASRSFADGLSELRKDMRDMFRVKGDRKERFYSSSNQPVTNGSSDGGERRHEAMKVRSSFRPVHGAEINIRERDFASPGMEESSSHPRGQVGLQRDTEVVTDTDRWEQVDSVIWFHHPNAAVAINDIVLATDGDSPAHESSSHASRSVPEMQSQVACHPDFSRSLHAEMLVGAKPVGHENYGFGDGLYKRDNGEVTRRMESETKHRRDCRSIEGRHRHSPVKRFTATQPKHEEKSVDHSSSVRHQKMEEPEVVRLIHHQRRSRRDSVSSPDSSGDGKSPTR
jgi:hypothetical protein